MGFVLSSGRSYTYMELVIHGWKATEVRIHMVNSYKILELPFCLQNFVNKKWDGMFVGKKLP